ncbi:DUF2920 family protein [Campylobacter lari]|nr:DUF2920 family protein [Campylobacter lari]HEG5919503.1 DUF2920 family protein [Campylobacter lari]
MLKNETYFIDSCDDVELGIKRESKLEYRITYDDEKTMKAIVFVIGGFGANANISFLDFDRKVLCEKFDVVVVNVFYHCFCVRKSNEEKYSAIKRFEEEDVKKLKSVLMEFGIKDHDVFLYNAPKYGEYLTNHIAKLKEENKLMQNYRVRLSAAFIPSNNEYQNFGIMAAIDHINVLKDIIKKYPKFKSLPKIYGGGSYGGYLALMCAKIAPWYVNGVIDNSGSALPPLYYIIGRDMDLPDYYSYCDHNVICFFVKTYWTRKDPDSPYYFADENYLIRALLNKDHLILQASKNKDIVYISYHSEFDEFKTAKDKINFYEFLKILNFDATLHLINDENQVDGKFIKSLDHGLRMSDKALLSKELPLMLEKLKDKTFDIKEDSISYPCKDKVFTFKDETDKFILEIL